MKYYLVFLKNGLVINVSNYDEKARRERDAMYFAGKLSVMQSGLEFDDVQSVDVP